MLKYIRYYIGDVTGTDPFWGDNKAYVTLNALFYPGIRTECARIAEGKPLNPAILASPERLRKVLHGLLFACRENPLTEQKITFRVERFADYLDNRNAGHTLSFTSTSMAGFLPAYTDRSGIAMMAWRLPAGTPCIPMTKVLPHYAKPDEAEILLPPFLQFTLRESPPPAHISLKDADGKPPLVCVHAEAGQCCPPERLPLPEGGHLAGQRVYHALLSGIPPVQEDIEHYTRWKAALITQIF